MTITATTPDFDPGPVDLADTTTDQGTTTDQATTTDQDTDSDQDTALDALATVQALPELAHVDPRTLIVSANVRGDAHLDKPFVASIRDQGVLVPIVARRRDDELHVVLGQRRTLGAVEAGRALVPVYIVDVPDEGKAAEILRIVTQIIENDHREGLTDSDRVRGHQQLALLGLSAGQIARRTRTGIGGVKTSLRVADSELAAAAMARYDLTLDQAGVLAEFEDDTEAVKALTVTAKKDPAQFPHLAQRLRDKRAEDAARASLLEQLAAAGVAVIDAPAYGETRSRKLRDLKAAQPPAVQSNPPAASADAEPAEGEPAEGDVETGEPVAVAGTGAMTPEGHTGCPGHAAYLEDRSRWSSTGEPVVAVYVCTDWKRYGHESLYADTLPAGSSTGGKMTDEQKAERRIVIDNNKAWDSAQVVRRDWLQGFLARKTAPKDAPQWIAVTLASCSHEVRRSLEDGHKLALELLGLAGEPAWSSYSGRPNPVTVATEKATPGRATMLTLGLLLGGLESTTSRSTWRTSTNAAHAAYFTALQQWGYGLSEVEQLVIPAEKPQKAKRTRKARTAEGTSDAVGDLSGVTAGVAGVSTGTVAGPSPDDEGDIAQSGAAPDEADAAPDDDLDQLAGAGPDEQAA